MFTLLPHVVHAVISEGHKVPFDVVITGVDKCVNEKQKTKNYYLKVIVLQHIVLSL